MSEYQHRDTLMDLLHDLLSDLWHTVATSFADPSAATVKIKKLREEYEALQRAASEQKPANGSQREAAEARQTTETRANSKAEPVEQKEVEGTIPGVVATETKSQTTVKSASKNLAKELAKSFIPFATSVDLWKDGKHMQSAFWFVLDAAMVAAWIFPPAGASASAALGSTKFAVSARRAGRILKVAEKAQKYPRALQAAKTGTKIAKDVAPVAHKINKLEMVKKYRARHELAQKAKVAAAIAEAAALAKEKAEQKTTPKGKNHRSVMPSTTPEELKDLPMTKAAQKASGTSRGWTPV